MPHRVDERLVSVEGPQLSRNRRWRVRSCAQPDTTGSRCSGGQG